MEIVEFRPEHSEAFRTLNEAWITKYFAIEDKDREVLGDPHGQIVAKGGRIFMAFDGAEPVGCVALIAMPDGGYEVAKMTVVETLRGSGLGRSLMQHCIDAGAEAGATRLYLETNSGLAPALGLYRAMASTTSRRRRTTTTSAATSGWSGATSRNGPSGGPGPFRAGRPATVAGRAGIVRLMPAGEGAQRREAQEFRHLGQWTVAILDVWAAQRHAHLCSSSMKLVS